MDLQIGYREHESISPSEIVAIDLLDVRVIILRLLSLILAFDRLLPDYDSIPGSVFKIPNGMQVPPP